MLDSKLLRRFLHSLHPEQAFGAAVVWQVGRGLANGKVPAQCRWQSPTPSRRYLPQFISFRIK
jgi:hypothetical protein